MGSNVMYKDIRNDKDYEKMAGDQFGIISTDKNCNMLDIAKNWKEYDYIKCDYLRLMSKKYSMRLRGHSLIRAHSDDQ